MTEKHVCVRFEKAGSVRVGEVSIAANGQTIVHKSTDQTLWKCKDCGGTVWLQTGIDPNVKALDGVRKEVREKR